MDFDVLFQKVFIFCHLNIPFFHFYGKSLHIFFLKDFHNIRYNIKYFFLLLGENIYITSEVNYKGRMYLNDTQKWYRSDYSRRLEWRSNESSQYVHQPHQYIPCR